MIRPIAIVVASIGLLTVSPHANAQAQLPPQGRTPGARLPETRPNDPARALEAQRKAAEARSEADAQRESQQARAAHPPKKQATEKKKEKPRKHRDEHEGSEAKGKE